MRGDNTTTMDHLDDNELCKNNGYGMGHLAAVVVSTLAIIRLGSNVILRPIVTSPMNHHSLSLNDAFTQTLSNSNDYLNGKQKLDTLINHAFTQTFRRFETDALTPIFENVAENLIDVSTQTFELFQTFHDEGIPSEVNNSDIHISTTIEKIDAKLQEARNLLHDNTPFISTICRFSAKFKNDSATYNGIYANKNTVYHDDRSIVRKYKFDAIFGDTTTLDQLFVYFYKRLKIVLGTTSALFIALGSSGSGKTYTLTGAQNEECTSDSDLGIIGRTLHKTLDESLGSKVFVSACEIFADGFRDIFSKKKKENGDDCSMDTLKKIRVKLKEDVYSVIHLLRSNRSSATTELNKFSSRTHLVVQVSISKNNWISKIVFVDLAGFEPMNKLDIKSSTFINSTVSALQTMLMSMVKKGERFSCRNSILTRLLTPFLNVDSKIYVLTTIARRLSTLRGDLNSLRTVSSLTGRNKKNT